MATQCKVAGQAIGASVTLTPYGPGEGFPLFVQPRTAELRSDADAAQGWFHAHRADLETLLVEAGALVFRGFPIHDTDAFTGWMDGYESPRFGYMAGSSPRKQLAARVYESTHAPAQDRLMMHQEMAYLPVYPSRIAFYCRVPAVSGGETLLADMRKVTAALPPAFVDAIGERGMLYTRNFRDRDASTGISYLDLVHRSWQDAFSSEDRDKVLEDCVKMDLNGVWLDDGSLSTAFRFRGLIDHPATGQRLWFNQIASTTMGKESIGHRVPVYEGYYGDHRPRPYLTTYGDGGRIPQAYLDALYAALAQHSVAFPWSHGDILFIDNYLTAHGRNSYTGERDIQVSLFS